MKEEYIKAHEELMSELIDENPNMSEDMAYKIAANRAYGHMTDRMADRIDRIREMRKYGEI